MEGELSKRQLLPKGAASLKSPGVLIFMIAFAVMLCGIFIFPYFVLLPSFVRGASYEVGFNNGLAYVMYILLLWFPVVVLSKTFREGVPSQSTVQSFRIRYEPSTILLVTLALHVCLFAALFVYKGQFVFADALYHQTLIYRMTLGDIPYIHFASNYGLGMLYPIYFLTQVLPVESAYAVGFVLTYLLGLYCLFLVVGLIESDGKRRDRLFLLFAIGLFNPWAALNVTFFRYLLPVMAFTSASSYFRFGGLKAGLLAIGWLAAAMLYTFDAGMVALISIVLLVIASVNYDRIARWYAKTKVKELGKSHSSSFTMVRRMLILIILALVIFVAVFFVIDPSLNALRLYPATALSYSAGAHNLPIYPSLPVVVVVCTTVLTAAIVLWAIRERRLSSEGGFLIGFLGMALLMERGAFGVAEPTHFAYYGIPIVLLCLFLIRSTDISIKGAERWLLASFIIGIVLPLQYYHASLFVPFLDKHWTTTGRITTSNSSNLSRQSMEETLTLIVERVGKDRNYLMFQLDYYSFPVYRKMGLKYPTYFTWLVEARTYKEIDEVIKQLHRNNVVLIARRNDLFPPQVVDSRLVILDILDRLSGSHPAGSNLAHLVLSNEDKLYRPLKDFIKADYEIMTELNGIVALVPKKSERSQLGS